MCRRFVYEGDGQESRVCTGNRTFPFRGLRQLAKKAWNQTLSIYAPNWDYMPFQNDSFDIVLFSEGPERPSDPIVTLSEINRVSKMNGYLSISAPICPKYVFIAESTEGFLKLTSKLKLPFRVPRKTLIAHKNVFSPSLLKKLVRPVGFKLEKCTLNPRPLGNLRVFSCSMILARKIGAARAMEN